MANLDKLVEDIIEDGKVDAQEVIVLDTFIFDDDKVDSKEVAAILLINEKCTEFDPSFTDLYVKVLHAWYSADGEIDEDECNHLISEFTSDNRIDERELAYLKHVSDIKDMKMSDKFKEFMNSMIEANI